MIRKAKLVRRVPCDQQGPAGEGRAGGVVSEGRAPTLADDSCNPHHDPRATCAVSLLGCFRIRTPHQDTCRVMLFW